MVNSHHRDGGPRPPPPNPSTGTQPSRSYAATAAAGESIRFNTIYSHAEYGRFAIPPRRNARTDHFNPHAIAYLLPKTISYGMAIDAALATYGNQVNQPIKSGDRHNIGNSDLHRVELVFNRLLDPTVVSNTPLNIAGTDYHPVSSTDDHIITRFAVAAFAFRDDVNEHIEVRDFAHLFTQRFNMGDVIKIEIPQFRTPGGNYAARSEFVFYTRGTNDANHQGIPRSLPFIENQQSPVKLGWNGAPAYCTYCRREGHFIRVCADRLSKLCNTCNAHGHVSAQCARFGERDRQANEGRGPVSATLPISSTASPPTVSQSTTRSTTITRSAPARSPSIFEFSESELAAIVANTIDPETQDEREGMSDVQSEEDNEPRTARMDVDSEGDVNTTTPTTTNATTETLEDQPPYTQIPATQTTSNTDYDSNEDTESNEENATAPSASSAPAKGLRVFSKNSYKGVGPQRRISPRIQDKLKKIKIFKNDNSNS